MKANLHVQYNINTLISIPEFQKLLKKVLSIPASSAAFERLFSVAGKIHLPERCCLSDSKFEQLMFIRSNTKY